MCIIMTAYSTVHTQQVLDQLWVGHQWFRVRVDGISAMVNLSECFKVSQQYITKPLGIYTWDFPLLCFLIFKATWSEKITGQLDHQHTLSWKKTFKNWTHNTCLKVSAPCWIKVLFIAELEHTFTDHIHTTFCFYLEKPQFK